ncbi:MAG: TIGR02281 family clan AA aspartic protease [Hyphomicrobiaceae bacterium]
MGTSAAHALRSLILWVGCIGGTFFGVYNFDALRELASGATGMETRAAATDEAEVASQGEDGSGFERIVFLKASDNGHFEAEAYIEGQAVNVLVDTGATGVALTYEDAEAIGIHLSDSDFTHVSRTANGTARIAPVTLSSIRIGDIEVKDVQAFVAEPGKLFATLLGMTFLSRLERVDIRGSELVLQQ